MPGAFAVVHKGAVGCKGIDASGGHGDEDVCQSRSNVTWENAP
jgi:hypothetical protein